MLNITQFILGKQPNATGLHPTNAVIKLSPTTSYSVSSKNAIVHVRGDVNLPDVTLSASSGTVGGNGVSPSG